MYQQPGQSGSSAQPRPRSRKRKLMLQDVLLGANTALPKNSRVSGIYQEGAKFRVVVFCPERQSIWCKTREEADAIAARLQQLFREQATRTVGEALEEYLEQRRQEGYRPNTLRCTRDKLMRILPLDRMLHTVTPDVAAELYRAETQRVTRYKRPMAAASHRAELKCARAFFRWTVEDKKYLHTNPFERVKPVGRVNAGKPQLRLDEARVLNAWLVERGQHDERATAVLTQLILGLRSTEVLRRQVRDVDDNGGLFCIESGKTKNARRWLEIKSAPLQSLLAKQARDRKPDELLFGANRDKPYTATMLWKWLKSFCREAGVPHVCPHSLRGLHSTLAMEHGATSGVVAAALGHGSFEITKRHYVEPTVLAELKQRKVSSALESPASSRAITLSQLSEALKTLTAEELAHLLRTVGTPQ